MCIVSVVCVELLIKYTISVVCAKVPVFLCNRACCTPDMLYVIVICDVAYVQLQIKYTMPAVCVLRFL